MKKLFVLFFAVAFSFSVASAQEIFQGTLKYDFKFMGEGVEAMEAMLPTGIEMNVLKSDMIVEMKGGMVAMMMGKILTKGKKGLSYMIKDAEETVYVMKPNADDEDAGAEMADPIITKEDETITIAGFECQKYKVQLQTPNGEMTQYVWATDKIKFPDMKGGGFSGGMGSSMRVKGLPGIPMKQMMTQGPMTVVITASEVSQKKLDKKMFKLPKGYSKEDFDPNSLMGGGMGM